MKWLVSFSIFIFVLTLLAVLCGYQFKREEGIEADSDYHLMLPKWFPEPVIPEDNRLTKMRVNLGKKLFYDKILSKDKTVSCSSCHMPEKSFTDNQIFSKGIKDSLGDRNAMSLVNLAWSNSFLWDGGASSLELQVLKPLTNPKEMDITIDEAIKRLNKNKSYRQLFSIAYNCKPDAKSLFMAIASFERTLVSSKSKYDKFYYERNAGIFTNSEIRGYYLFNGMKTHCSSCHTGVNLTNSSFQNNGLYIEYKDQGRFKITGKVSDKGKFKVPTLRNIALTAPYMHDGSLKTLEEVVNHYASGGRNHPNKSSHVHNNDAPQLTDVEKKDLISFLKTLTDDEFINNAAFRP